jgi:hypothetical protein
MADKRPHDARTIELPEGVLAKPKPVVGSKFKWPGDRNFKEPIRWLLGDQIIADLKLLALHGIFGDKLDARDWMSPDLIRIAVKDEPSSGPPPSLPSPEKVSPPGSVSEAVNDALNRARRLIELPCSGDQCGIDP